jgi:hypothetical protein
MLVKGDKKEKQINQPLTNVQSGTNLEGRSGLFYGDTAEVAKSGSLEGSLHAAWAPPVAGAQQYTFPLGVHYGVCNDFEVSAGVKPALSVVSHPGTPASYVLMLGLPVAEIPAKAGNTTSTMDVFIHGGFKYLITSEKAGAPDFSLGANAYLPAYSDGAFVAMPEASCTYFMKELVLNGDLGLGLGDGNYVKLDAGLGWAVLKEISLICEIGVNQDGYTNSMFALGARAGIGGTGVKAQALWGVNLNTNVGLAGLGLILGSN